MSMFVEVSWRSFMPAWAMTILFLFYIFFFFELRNGGIRTLHFQVKSCVVLLLDYICNHKLYQCQDLKKIIFRVSHICTRKRSCRQIDLFRCLDFSGCIQHQIFLRKEGKKIKQIKQPRRKYHQDFLILPFTMCTQFLR